MSMCDFVKEQLSEQVQNIDAKGNTVTTEMKVIKRIYPCRPQVIQRQQRWIKFGQKAKNIERGKNDTGILTITGPSKFITDEGQELNQEIQIAKDLIQLGKKHQVSKQLKM